MFIIYGSTTMCTWVIDATENEITAYAIADKYHTQNPDVATTVERIR